MNPDSEELKVFLMQAFEQHAEANGMSKEALREVVEAIVTSGAIEVVTPEEVAQCETDALFARCGVKGFEKG